MTWQRIQQLQLQGNWVYTSQVFPEEIIRITAKHPKNKYLIKIYICQAFPGYPPQIWDVKRLYLTSESQIIKMSPIREITELRAIGIRGATSDNAYKPEDYRVILEKWVD